MRKLLIAGQTLFEVMVAIGLAAMILTAIVSLSTTSLSNTTANKNNTLATKYAQEGVEWARQQRDISWATFTGYTGCLGKNVASSQPEFNNCSKIDNIFSRNITITSSGDEAKVLVIVSWSDGKNKDNEVVASTLLTDWQRN